MIEPSKEAWAEARELRSAWLEQANDTDNGLGLTEFIALALDQARSDERDACLAIAQFYVDRRIADAIRNRART